MGDGNRDLRTAVLKKWMLVCVGGKMHLVGVVDGQTRLPSGHWIITSPLSEFDPVAGTATTRSSGRRYSLRDRWQAEAPPEAADVVAKAIQAWRLSSDVTVAWDIAVAPT
jgi:hypothetical protein